MTRWLYFTISDETRLKRLVVARRALGDECFILKCVEDARSDAQTNSTCIFIADQYDPAILEQVRAIGVRIALATLDGEEHRVAQRKEATKRNAQLPSRPEHLFGNWFAHVVRHVIGWEPSRGKGVLLLLNGPSGSGKTCAIESVLPAAAQCSVRVVHLADTNAEGAVAADSPDSTGEVLVATLGAVAKHCARAETGRTECSRLVVFFDSIEDVVGQTAACVAGISRIAALAAAYPRKVALIAACDNWYSRAPLVHALRKGSPPFAVELRRVPAPSAFEMEQRLRQCIPGIAIERARAVATRCNGNMWAALNEFAFGAAVASADRTDQRAPCERAQAIVATAARALCEKERGLFTRIDTLSSSLDYAAETITDNILSLVPQDPGCALDAMCRAYETLSMADTYTQHQHDVHFAGRDGQDVDRAIAIALGATSPCIALALSGAGSRGNLLRRDTLRFAPGPAFESRRTFERNADIIAEARHTLRFLTTTDEHNRLATVDGRQDTRAHPAHAVSFPVDDLDYVSAHGSRGVTALRALGFKKHETACIVAFSRELGEKTKIAALETEYALCDKTEKREVAKRPASAATKRAPAKKTKVVDDPRQRKLTFPKTSI